MAVINVTWSSNMFVIRSRVGAEELAGDVDDLTLSELASGVRALILRAYDGESYVVWDLET